MGSATCVASGTPHYEQSAAFDAVFDRLLICRSHVLHCGMMPLVAGPRRGRLTANIFLTYRTT